MASPDITEAYRARLAAQRAGLLALLAALFGRVFDPANPVPGLTAIGGLAGTLTVRGQAVAVAGARGYLAQLTGTPPRTWPVPDDVIGGSDSGRAITDLTRLAPAVYLRQRPRLGDAAAGLAALAWLNRLAASEPVRAANRTVLLASSRDRRLTGRYRRATRAGCCSYCRQIADGGYTDAAAGFAAHANCQCTATPEVRTR